MTNDLPYRVKVITNALAILNQQPALTSDDARYAFHLAPHAVATFAVVDGTWHYWGIDPEISYPKPATLDQVRECLKFLNTEDRYSHGFIGSLLGGIQLPYRIDMTSTACLNASPDYEDDYYRVLILCGGTVLFHDVDESEWRYLCQF